MAAIFFTDDALEDLRRLGPSIAPRILKKILLLEQSAHAGLPLADELTGFRKLVVGDNTWRVIYRVDSSGDVEVCEIWAAGKRSDAEVYQEASARVAQAGRQRPGLRPLAEVIEKLGRLAGDVQATATAPRAEPVPDWLADRLVHTAGYSRAAVAAMDGPEAMERWEQFITQPPA